MIVEVEAYGGVPDGPWPDAAAHSYRGLSGRNAVMFGPRRAALHLSQPRHPRLRERGVRDRRSRRRGPASGRGDRDRASTSREPAAAAGPYRPALARGPGNLCSALGITMDDNGIDLFDARQPGAPRTRRSRRRRVRPARRCQPGRRPAVAVLAAGRPRCRPIAAVRGRRRPAPATDHREDAQDAGIYGVRDPRRAGLARTDRTVHRPRRAGAKRWPRARSPSTRASTRPRRACTPAIWCRC